MSMSESPELQYLKSYLQGSYIYILWFWSAAMLYLSGGLLIGDIAWFDICGFVLAFSVYILFSLNLKYEWTEKWQS